MHSIFKHMKKYLSGAAASSLNEAKLAYSEFHKAVHVYSPAYISSEFDELLSLADHITFNSLSEWERYRDKIARHTKTSAGIRINPEYSEITIDLYNPCLVGSRLGIVANALKAALPEGIEGLHFHTLCESSTTTLANTLAVVESKFGHLLDQAKWLNMGGGHAITKKGYDIYALIDLIRNMRDKYQIAIILEPSSAIAWQAGWLISTVLDIQENKGIRTAILDISFAAHLPDCLEVPYKPKVWQANKTPAAYRYHLGGLTCLAGDFLPDYFFEKPLKVGDKIIFNNMIHYTMVKTNTFNGINLPAIGILKKDNTFQLVKQFGYTSYKSRL